MLKHQVPPRQIQGKSNTIKIIASMKNRRENGTRALFFGSNPHSNGQLACLCVEYRCVDNIMPSDFCKMFIVNSTFHLHDTRIKNKLH